MVQIYEKDNYKLEIIRSHNIGFGLNPQSKAKIKSKKK
jgi:hypothetical protein